MDVLRKELNAIYEGQQLAAERLDPADLALCRGRAQAAAEAADGCMVVTDAAADRCYIYGGTLACLLGLAGEGAYSADVDSSDEDIIYMRIHPEDLVDKRMLEYEFFRFIDTLPPESKLHYRATCRLRIRDRHGRYVCVDNSTRVAGLSPAGKMWLILCTYDLSPRQSPVPGIAARIVNGLTGDISDVELTERRTHILTPREKEILNLVREGRPSKQIAAALGISIHTVNRHRQNILEKLSVGNSVEAIMAASLMKLV